MWVSRRGGAAGESPTPEQIEQWRRKMSPPENELPASVKADFSDRVDFHPLSLVESRDSQLDGATKLVFRTEANYLIESVIMRALAKKPSDRPQSALELGRDFRRAASATAASGTRWRALAEPAPCLVESPLASQIGDCVGCG